jgi:hypothetical protein
MEFGRTNQKLNKQLREAVLASDYLQGGSDGFGDLEAYEKLAKYLTGKHDIDARAVHDNSDGTAKQCQAYFLGMKAGLEKIVEVIDEKWKVATVSCREPKSLKRPPRLYVLVREDREDHLLTEIQNFLKNRVMDS